MIIKKIETASLFLFTIFALLTGCSSVSETNTVKNVNTNQAVIVSNANTNLNNSNVAVANNVTVNGNVADKQLSPSTPPSIANVIANVANKKNATPVNPPAPQIGNGANDLFLVIQVKGALTAADKDFTNSVIVDNKEGNIVLSGNVPNEAARTKAAQIAQSVKGVKKVQNSLHVSQ